MGLITQKGQESPPGNRRLKTTKDLKSRNVKALYQDKLKTEEEEEV